MFFSAAAGFMAWADPPRRWGQSDSGRSPRFHQAGAAQVASDPGTTGRPSTPTQDAKAIALASSGSQIDCRCADPSPRDGQSPAGGRAAPEAFLSSSTRASRAPGRAGAGSLNG